MSTSDDEYRRGRAVTRGETRPEVRSRYRRLLPVVWGVGAVLFVVALGFGPLPGLAVVGVMHVFFFGLIRADIASLRRQGVNWGVTRHVWLAAALLLPFAVPAYYVVSGRKMRTTNERRGYDADRD